MQDNIEKEILRKISIRKETKRNMGIEEMKENKKAVVDELEENLLQAESSAEQTGYWNLTTGNNKLKLFVKRVIRKILYKTMGWLIFPIFQHQNYFNKKILNSVSLLRLQYSEYLTESKIKINDLMIENRNLKNENEKNKQQLECLEKKIYNYYNNYEKRLSYLEEKMNCYYDEEIIKNSTIDYVDFENYFRGKQEDIKESVKPYLNYFQDYKDDSTSLVVDFGCGRGEFLELMKENGINAVGIECYKPFVELCKKKGLKVEEKDALDWLSKCEDDSISGIYMGQVVEHLSFDYLVAFIRMAYKKLKKESYFILETPNPQTLSTFCNFYIDNGHNKPVHFLTLKYLFENSGYCSVERYDNPVSLYPYALPVLEGEEKNIQLINEGFNQMNNLLFGYRDYTLIAKK